MYLHYCCQQLRLNVTNPQHDLFLSQIYHWLYLVSMITKISSWRKMMSLKKIVYLYPNYTFLITLMYTIVQFVKYRPNSSISSSSSPVAIVQILIFTPYILLRSNWPCLCWRNNSGMFSSERENKWKISELLI